MRIALEIGLFEIPGYSKKIIFGLYFKTAFVCRKSTLFLSRQLICINLYFIYFYFIILSLQIKSLGTRMIFDINWTI